MSSDSQGHVHDGSLVRGRRGPSVSFIFPVKLYDILSRDDLSHIITWMSHGRSWIVLDKKAFVEQVMTEYFSQSQYASFIRQVNGWGFRRMKKGVNKGSYYNKLFLRGQKALARTMKREAASKRCSSESEPDFSSFPLLPSGEEPKGAQSNWKSEGSSGSRPTCQNHATLGNTESFDFSPAMSDQKYSCSTESNMHHEHTQQNYHSHPMMRGYSTQFYPEHPIYPHPQASFVGHDSHHATSTFSYQRLSPQVPLSDWTYPLTSSPPYYDFHGSPSTPDIPNNYGGSNQESMESPIRRNYAVESYEESKPEDWERIRDTLCSYE